MGDLLSPDPPEPQILDAPTAADPAIADLTSSDIARQRAQRRARATTRSSLRIDPATNTGSGNGLRIG